MKEGSIIIVHQPEYGRPYTGERWDPGLWTFSRAFRVDYVNNNGTIRGHDCRGNKRWFDERFVKEVKK